MRLNDKRVVADFALAVRENRNIEILSNGSPTRTFCYVADAVLGHLKVLLYGKYDYFNIGIDKPEITISQLAEIYAQAGREILGYTGRVTYGRSEDTQYLTDNPPAALPFHRKGRAVCSVTLRVFWSKKEFDVF